MPENMFKGFEGTILLNGDPVGRVETFSVDINNNLDRFFEVGSRIAAELKEGNFEVSGSINSGFINKAKLELAIGNDGITMVKQGRIPEMTLLGKLVNSNTGKAEWVTLKGVKFGTWSFEIGASDWVMENVDFDAINIQRGSSANVD